VNNSKETNPWAVTAAIVLGTLAIGLTMSMLNLGIPLMLADLRTDLETIQWIITGPMLVNIALVPLVSWLTTRLGTRNVYLWAIAIWVATSLPCGLATTPGGLIVARLLQGIGGSLQIPTAIVVMYLAFPRQQRGLAMGLQQGVQWVAPALGMTLGGYLLELHGWRAGFWYPIPIGIASLGLTLWVLPNVRGGTHKPLDLAGLGTLTLALTLLLLAVSQGQRPGWTGIERFSLIGAGLLATAVFVWIERRQATPLFEFTLFRTGMFRTAVTVYFLNHFAAMGVSFAVIVVLQRVFDYSPLQVGWLLLPATLGRVLGEVVAGRLADRWGAWGLCRGGLAMLALASGALGQLEQSPGALALVGLLVLANTGMAFSNAPVLYTGLRALPEPQIQMGSGLFSQIRIIGGTFGVGVVGPLVALCERWGRQPPRDDAATMVPLPGTVPGGYQGYFDLIALLMLVTLVLAVLMPSHWRRAAR